MTHQKNGRPGTKNRPQRSNSRRQIRPVMAAGSKKPSTRTIMVAMQGNLAGQPTLTGDMLSAKASKTLTLDLWSFSCLRISFPFLPMPVRIFLSFAGSHASLIISRSLCSA